VTSTLTVGLAMGLAAVMVSVAVAVVVVGPATGVVVRMVASIVLLAAVVSVVPVALDAVGRRLGACLAMRALFDVVRTRAIMPVGDLDRSLVLEPVVAVRYPLWIVGVAGGGPIMIVRRWVVIGFPGRVGILTVGSRGRREARSLTAALTRAMVKGAVAGGSAGGSALAQHWLNSASNLGSRSMSSWPDILVAIELEQAFRRIVGSVVGGV